MMDHRAGQDDWENEDREIEASAVDQPEIEVIAEGSEDIEEVTDVAESTFLQDMESMRQELEEARTKADEYLDGWQRSRAEFSNYRKRVERDQAQSYQSAVGNITKRYLEIADDLARALENRPESGEGASWAQGIELIYRKLISMLEAEGITAMEVEGQFFDPNLHEAVTQEESDQYESGQIIGVVKHGYMLGDRVLRPALVRVAR